MLRTLVLLPLIALFSISGCGGHGGASTYVPASDPDPNFVAYEDSVPDEYIATFAETTHGSTPDPRLRNGPAIAAAICRQYGATLIDTYEFAGSFSFEANETTARALSHDRRVAAVETDAVTTGAGWTGSTGTTGSTGLPHP